MRTLKKITLTGALALSIIACTENKADNALADNSPEQKVESKKENNAKEDSVVIIQALNANLATESELNRVGLTDSMVDKILELRPFIDLSELESVINYEKGDELYSKIFIPLNLNTTSEDQFLKIPGVGKKMAHEFEEYRPYKSLNQFRREIGKYVDESEIDRYLNYVFVPVELNDAAEKDIEALPGVGSKIAHEFMEYRPYKNLEQFRKEIGKYVDDKELKRLERFVYLKN